MNIYLISQDQNDDYDTFDSAVVYAESEEQAKNINPNETSNDVFMDWTKTRFSPWCNSPEHVKVSYIGTNPDITEPGVICASFNAV